MANEIIIPSNPSDETLITALDLIIEAQDNGYPIMITNDNETNAVLYKDPNKLKVTTRVAGMDIDLVALRRKALKNIVIDGIQ